MASQRTVRFSTSRVAPPTRIVDPTQSNSAQAGTPEITMLGRNRDGSNVLPVALLSAAIVSRLTIWRT